MLAVEADRVRGEGHPPGCCPAVPAGAPDRRTRHSSQRRRLAVHLGPVRRHPDAPRARRVGRAGRDAYDNALAETALRQYQTECTRACRRQGSAPPPHVKPHSATLTTAASQPAPLLTQNQVCTKLGMLHTLISPVRGFALPYTPLARCSPGAQAERSPRHCLVL